MNDFFPIALLYYLNEFCQCFTSPSFVYFKAYIWAMLMNSGNKRMTNVASVCFFLDKNISSFRRFLSENQWNMRTVAQTLLNILLQRLGNQLTIHDGFLACVDTTLVSKTSEKMVAVQRWHQHSGNSDKLSSIIGHHWAIIGLIAKHPIRFICLPILTRLIQGHGTPQLWIAGTDGVIRVADFWDSILPLVAELKSYLPSTIKLRLVADAYFSKVPFIKSLLAQNVHLISRLRKDSVAWDPLSTFSFPRKRGRPKTKGTMWKLVNLLKFSQQQSLETPSYGHISFVLRDVYLRNLKNLVRVLVIATNHKPIILLSTDLSLSPQQIIEIYSSRFSIEFAIRDLKQHFGFADYQCYSTIAFFRFVFLSCISYCLAMLLLIEKAIIHPFNSSNSLFHSEAFFSFSRFKRIFKSFVCRQIIFRQSANTADFDKIQQELDALLSVA